MTRALIVLVAAAVALSAATAALAGDPGTDRSRPSAGLWDAGAFQAWKKCLTAHGLVAPRGAPGTRGVPWLGDLTKARAAFEECRTSLPSPVKSALARLGAFRDCLEQHSGTGAPTPGTKPPGFDFSKVRVALDACRSLLPGTVRAAQDGLEKYRDCLREHGWPPAGTHGQKPSDGDRATRRAAFDACRSLLPAPAQKALAAFDKYRDCLRDNGWPAAGARGAGWSDADRAKRKAAFQACRSLLPQLPHRAHARFR